jgi:exopolysaccharide biosynthesis WecB/TagA/CpsF family protein
MRTESGAAPTRREFLGLRFDRLSADELVDLLRQASHNSSFSYVVTPNVDHVVRLSRSGTSAAGGEELAAAYAESSICVCDSRILQRLGRLVGVRLPLVTGSDLTVRLFRDVISEGDIVGLIGGTNDVVAALRASLPSVSFLHHAPPMQMLEKPQAMSAAVRFACSHPFRFLFIAVGSPQQEILAKRIADTGTGSGWGLCIGAGVDFVVERQRRAPLLLQQLGLEWAYRLAGNPRRLWRRYLVVGPRIVPLLIRWLAARSRQHAHERG